MHTRWTPLIAVLLLAAACSSGDDDDQRTAPTTSAPPATTAPAPTTTTPAPATTAVPTTTTTTVVDEEAAVIAAYLAYWDTFLLVTNPGQPDNPLIDQVATGAAADRLRRIAQEQLSANQAIRVPENSQKRHEPQVVGLEPDRATVGDCLVDDSFRVDLATGEVFDDDLASSLWTVTLERGADRQWRVAELTRLARWEGIDGCAIG